MTANRLLKALILCPLLVLITQVSWGQKTISGKILDEKGNPVVGASVVVKGGKVGTTTDATGHFNLNAPSGTTTVVVSYVGYGSKELDVTSSSDLAVTMQPTNTSLSDIVVVGYGTSRKKDITGSVAAVTTKDFNKGVISTPEQLIIGRTPGVTVTPANGEPGASSVINIRGSSSIRSNQEPLYVVDGVPLGGGGTTGTASGVEGSSTPKNPLIFLNPNDIESITILKDASSAAIYGSRGANGVILITTKGGRGATGGFQFSTNVGVSNVEDTYNLLNGPDYLNAIVEANVAAGVPRDEAEVNVQFLNKGANTDWQDIIFRTGISQNYNLAWGFNKKATNLRLSGSYEDQQGIVENSSLKRLTGRANFTQKFAKDKFKFEAFLTYSNTKNSYPPLTDNAGYLGSLIGATLGYNPTIPIFDSAGFYTDLKDGNRNPAEMLAYFDDNDKINRYLSNLTLTWQITKDLSYKFVFGYDKSKSERISFADPRLSSNAFGGTNTVFGVNLNNGIQGNGRVFKQNVDVHSVLVEHYLTYNKTFSGGSVINAVGGYSYQNFQNEYNGVIGWGLSTPVVNPNDVFVKDFNNFTNYYDDVPGFEKAQLQSFFGRVNYSLSEKYFLTATVRADGSSRFGANNRYGVFPAFAAKWRLLRETFAQGLTNTFSDLSIRANWGKLGSQEGIGAYDAYNLQQTYKGNSGPNEVQLRHLGNPDLQWEEATTTGVGLDFALRNSRLTGAIDYYSTKRDNLLFYGPTPGGFAPTANWFTNLPGHVVNTGVEVSFDFLAVKSSNFSWDIDYNMTFMHNEMKDFPLTVITGGVNGQGLSGAYAQTIVDGYPLFTWKMPVFEGYDKDGFATYANGGQDQLLGSALPTFTAGLTNNFTYKNWSASIFFNAVTGFSVYNNTANALFLKGAIKNGRNVTYDVASSPESPINPGSVSTRFLEDGDFIRLSNASISYAFNLKNTKTIKSLALSVIGQNLALFTDYSGLDPEINVDHNINGVPSRGFDYTAYPRPRTVTFGLNLGF